MSKKTLKPVDLDLDAPGKDLTHLFASSLSRAPEAHDAIAIPIERLLDNPYQPRTPGKLDEEALSELSEIVRAQGFQGVLVARPHPEQKGHYQITAGHRRREAARRAGLVSLPVIVQDLTDEEMVTLAITENIQREDLTPLEEGRIYILMQEQMGYSLEQIAREVGRKIGYIYNRVRVAKAPPDVQALVETKADSLRAVANLIKVKNEEDRAHIIEELLAGTLTTDDLPVYIRDLATERAAPAPPVPPDNEQPVPEHIPAGPEGDARRGDDRVVSSGLEEIPYADDGDAGGGEYHPVEAQQTQPAGKGTVLVNGVRMEIERSPIAVDRGLPEDQRAGAAPGGDSATESEQRARLRARRSKLSRLLGMLRSFGDGAAGGPPLSREERLDLAMVALLANRLCAEFGIDPDHPDSD